MAGAGVKDRTEYHRRWRHENPEKLKAQRERHREKRIALKRKWYEAVMADPERRKDLIRKAVNYHRQKRENDPEYAAKSKARAKRYYHKKRNDQEYMAKNRERSLRQYYDTKNDPERHQSYLAKNRKRMRIRRRQDPDFAIKGHLRGRLGLLLRKGHAKPEKSAIELTGVSIPELRVHLEKQFKPGMSWENYGPVWHIDHIIPCSKFDLMDPRHQAICFNYLNLQPLWAKENVRKGNRIPEDSKLPLELRSLWLTLTSNPVDTPEGEP